MRVAIVTDAWAPQVNGVVRTLQAVIRELEATGHQVLVVSPDRFASLPCPTYPEIRLALAGRAGVGRLIEQFDADAIHLATEGPLCLAARRWCLARALPFTTAYHTRFPDYVSARTGIDPAWVWRYIGWFHAPSRAILASTPSVARELEKNGLHQVRTWGRGVDFSLFGSGGPRDPTVPRATTWRGVSRTRTSSAPAPGRRLPPPIAAPTRSSSRAAPTPSGW